MTTVTRGSRSVAAVVLAAGASRRFGARNKLLVPWGREDAVPVVRHVVQVLEQVPISDIVVVTGNASADIRAALDGTGVTFVHNEAWSLGMGHSIAAGISAVGQDAAGAFIVPGDMPALSPDVLRSLVRAFEGSDGSAVVVPVIADGAQRNPVLWPRAQFGSLADLHGDRGAKALLEEAGLHRIDVKIIREQVFADIDQEDDYRVLSKALFS